MHPADGHIWKKTRLVVYMYGKCNDVYLKQMMDHALSLYGIMTV